VCIIDDFAFADPTSWHNTGVALLEAVQREAKERGTVLAVEDRRGACSRFQAVPDHGGVSLPGGENRGRSRFSSLRQRASGVVGRGGKSSRIGLAQRGTGADGPHRGFVGVAGPFVCGPPLRFSVSTPRYLQQSWNKSRPK